MLYLLRVVPDPVLAQPTLPLPKDATLDDMIDSMISVMHASHGIGLAANQVGLSHSLFVTGLEEIPVAINPEILSRSSSTQTDQEGCLSVPLKRALVTRPETVTIRYLDRSRAERTETLSGYPARVICHELDHLLGTTLLSPILGTSLPAT